ncbi:ciliogenesis and planar polarity effector 1 isoform X3 [Syngnathoides biaculeatus]|uniref:ciliogenesis and planar polarity effector 1 isoform X3 n=1 Tax=Syngnathoides biaculeatus TaxID=300417 RepID=UPI002ADE1455|nr:ciliogenesis and planar polarity effector 1 isoform X3 [Syngnathoides biaculeatus]
MELKLDVILTSSIKRKKPWPRFCWLGQEKECVFMVDDKRISEINMVSGRTKKKTPKLQPFLNNVVTMAPSHNGVWFCGLLTSGELFLWNKDKDVLRTVAAVPEVAQMITAIQGNGGSPSIHVSGDGTRTLLATKLGQVFLWECTDVEDLALGHEGSVKGRWAQIQSPQDNRLPTSKDKEASQCGVFAKSQVVGDVCLSAFVFTSAKKLIVTCLKVQWTGDRLSFGTSGYSIQWATKSYPMSRLSPPCQGVKSRGALVVGFSPDGQLLAVVLNQRQPKATQVLFVSTQNFVSVSSGLGRCGCKTEQIPSKYIRSYWVGGLSWSHDSLFLACVLKRGALLVLVRLGGLLTLNSSGCKTDFGPAQFLPLHPLVTYRPPTERADAHLSSSSVSARDAMRQRYSVAWHPRLLYCIVSDGYMATVLRVLDRPSPAMLVKALLDNTSKELQKACQLLERSQMYARTPMESYRSLDAKSFATSGPHPADSVRSSAFHESSLPLFLQDQSSFSGTKEMFKRIQSFFEDDSDVDGPPPGSQLLDSGHLEFASMFDTLHALDTETDHDHEEDFERVVRRLRRELGKIQNGLLTAWALCVSLGAAVENQGHLLECTVVRAAQLAALFHSTPTGAAHPGRTDHSSSARILELLKTLFSFLPWDNAHLDGLPGLKLAVELSKRIVHLLLEPPPESCPSGFVERLSGAVLVLRLASDALDCAYSFQRRTIWSSLEKDPQVSASDVHHVPLLQDCGGNQSGFVHQGLPLPHRPSSRLFGVWEWVYKVSQKYKEDTRDLMEDKDWEEGDEEHLSAVVSEIQAALEATGQKLEEDSAQLSHKGEELFLCGMYQDSAETWRTEIWEESRKCCHRSAFQETRLCLALLYSFLSQYQLREAMELGEHMAHLLLHSAGYHNNRTTCTSADPLLPTNLHDDAAVAVIQTLARFMASYFTNQPLNIPPAHHVAVLPPLHLPHGTNAGRLAPLCQEAAARAVRQQNMSEKWTVDYALDLLLLGGLLPETAWLASKLGDWKTAASLSLAYVYYCAGHLDFTQLNKLELQLPKKLIPEGIFEAELQNLLDDDNGERSDDVTDTRVTDPLEGQDLDALQGSAQEILKASVIAGVDVLTSPLTSLLESAKDLCSGLSALVHNGLYLPSPPLYCPQPSPNTQEDPVGTAGQLAEVATRHKVSGVLQRILLLLRSARCCHPAAQWYVRNLRRAHHLLHKIKTKYAYPSFPKEEKALPEDLLKFVCRGGFFKTGHGKDLDPNSTQTIICFRELCGLCWMLHVRDRLSLACRRYQAARMQPDADGSQVHSSCLDALLWAHRYLPFCHFLNAEEILQDLLLSLLAELPPLDLVADTLVLAFPERENSVRVPLREKYKLLLQSLRQCNVLDEDKQAAGKPVKRVIRSKLRQRKKHLGRLLRHLAPPELRLWEKDEDTDDKRGPASASASTFTDGGESAQDTSEGASPDPRNSSIPREVKSQPKRSAVPTKRAADDFGRPSLPVVGTWEFELEDDEYPAFLELFLSYMLEKDGGDRSEPPLLKSFCPALRDRELHSLTFDVLTTMHRRQKDGQHPTRKHGGGELPVFRAGCCRGQAKNFASPESQTSAAWIDGSESRSNISAFALPKLRTASQMGLFGFRRRKGDSPSDNHQSFLPFGSSTATEAIVELQQVLDSKLEMRFPVLGRLLEWMLRWADKRVLLGHPGKKKKPKGAGKGEDGIVIRVKTSTPAVLTSLSLLERRFLHLLRPCCPEARSTFAPVPQPEVDVRPEIESSIDIGYPKSANTPVPALDHNVEQGEVSTSDTDESEEPKSHRTPLPDQPDDLNSSSPIRSSASQQPGFEDLDVTPEKEGKSSDDRSEQSFSLSNGILCSPQASLKHGELIGPSCSTSLLNQAGSHPVTRASGSIPQLPNFQPPASFQAELPRSSQSPQPNTPLNHPSSVPHTHTAGPQDNFVSGQPSSFETPPMRQRLGEDLYRLVQNINYMSLMDVLGASFSSLQLAQQNSYINQSNVNPFHPYVPSSSYASNIPPQQNPQPAHTPAVSQSQIHVPNPRANNPRSIPASAPASPVHGTREGDHVSNLPCNRNEGGGIYQEFQPLSVQAESTDVHFKESARFIPSSQGLLITSNANTTAPSVGNSNTDPSSRVWGLKLLDLDGGGKSDKRRTSSAPKRLLRFSRSAHSESNTRNSHDHNPTSKATDGLRLLHLLPGARGHIDLPKLPSRPPPPKRFFVPTMPLVETHKLQLLRIEPEPRKMPTPAPSSVQKARLISLEELAVLVAGRRNSEEARLQLLRVNDSGEAHRGAAASSASSKRQKRRERAPRANPPNENITTTQEPKEELEEITPTRDCAIQRGASPTPQGTGRPVSTGRTLLDKARTTSAELHAFASTCKRAPECLDAFTNTEPRSSPILVDKAVSPQATLLAATSTGKSKEQMFEKVHRENPSRDANDISPVQEKRNLDLSGRNFLSVLDIEEGTQHQDLPPASSGPKEASSVPPVLTPAQLHLLAASIVKSAHPADEKTAKTVTRTDLCDGTAESNREPVSVHSQDGPNSRLCKVISTRREGPHNLEPQSFYSEELPDSEHWKAIRTRGREIPQNVEPESFHSEELPDSEHCKAIRTRRKEGLHNLEPERFYSEDLLDSENCKAIRTRGIEIPQNVEPDSFYSKELPDSELCKVISTRRREGPHNLEPERFYSEDLPDSEHCQAIRTRGREIPQNVEPESFYSKELPDSELCNVINTRRREGPHNLEPERFYSEELPDSENWKTIRMRGREIPQNMEPENFYSEELPDSELCKVITTRRREGPNTMEPQSFCSEDLPDSEHCKAIGMRGRDIPHNLEPERFYSEYLPESEHCKDIRTRRERPHNLAPERFYSEDLPDSEHCKAIRTRRRERPHNLEPDRFFSEELADSELRSAMKTPRREIPCGEEPKKVSLHYSEDSTDSEHSKAIKTPRIDGPPDLPSETAAIWFSSHMNKLDSQLAALQNIANCLEKDLPQSRLPKQKPRQVSPSSPPNLRPAIKKTVRLFLPAEQPKTPPKHAYSSVRKNILETGARQSHSLTEPEPDICEEDEGIEEEEEEDVFRNDRRLPDKKPPALQPPSTSQLRHDHQSHPKHLSTETMETFDDFQWCHEMAAEENLDQTGLSDTTEILEGLVREGYISQTDLDASLSNTLDDRRERREPSRQIPPGQALPDEDDDRRELKMWMRRKQRERHSVYQKQRANLREKEIKPFSRTSKKTSQATSRRNTQEKQKATLLKQFNQRLHDAALLADQLRTSPFSGSRVLVIDAPVLRSSSAPPSASNCSKEKGLKRPSGQTQRRPWTAEAPGRPSQDRVRTELQQRSGAALSRERPITSVGPHQDQDFTQQDVNQLLSEVMDERDDGAGAGVAGMDWLDRLTEGGGSLSEVDWAAIERMAAVEENG